MLLNKQVMKSKNTNSFFKHFFCHILTESIPYSKEIDKITVVINENSYS